MDPLTRAALVALAVFAGICALFFVQPFTGWFPMVAIPAAIVAGAVFLALRPRSPPQAASQLSGAAVAAATLGILLILLGLLFAVGRWPTLWDPCHTWEDKSTSGVISPDDPCASSSSTTQSRRAFILDSLAGEGLLMAGGALAVWASRRHARAVLAAIGVAMLLPTAILFRGMSLFFIVSFALGLALVVVALLMRPGRRVEAPAPSA